MIDTHCHLNLGEHFPDAGAELQRAANSGVDRVIVVGIDAPSNEKAVRLAEEHAGVYAVVGWHPNSASSFDLSSLALLESLAKSSKVVAIGEIGLDYHWDFATKEAQMRALHAQLDFARSLGLPIVFHCREAYDDLLDVLEGREQEPYLFHCFSGNAVHHGRCLAIGGMIGVDGPITYKKSGDLRELIRETPDDRIVLETDSPYLSPEPVRGKPNTPANLKFILAGVASCKGWNLEQCEEITTRNAERFFGL